jgi:hypothetical protein
MAESYQNSNLSKKKNENIRPEYRTNCIMVFSLRASAKLRVGYRRRDNEKQRRMKASISAQHVHYEVIAA